MGAFAARVGANDYEVSLKTHIDILLLRKRSVMCVFPEGNKTRDGNLLPAKGVAYLATRTNTPLFQLQWMVYSNDKRISSPKTKIGDRRWKAHISRCSV